jgi:type I restriction enzyme S subunit
MANEMKSTLLRDLLVTTKDGDWGKENPEGGYVPYHIIRGTDFPDVRVGDLSSVPLRYLPEHTVKRRTLEPNDILIETAGGTRDRPTGRTLLITEKVLSRFRGPVTCASFARFLRIDRKQADPSFVFWYLQHLYDKGEMSQHQVQHTGVARFQYTRFAETQKVPLPPLAEQRAIAAVLGALDDKIELNRRMNATLEAMARALFQSWFVDFDPVRAKLDRRQPTGLDESTAALFPDSFQDSELGHVPKGWNAKPLPEAIEVNPRCTLKAGTVAPYLDMKNLPTQGHSAEKVVERVFSSGTRFENGDTLLARITPCLENGKTGYVDFLKAGQVGWGSTEYIVFRPKPPLPPQFGYFLARSDSLRTHAIQNMTGTSGRQRVPSECFNSFLIAVPPPQVAHRFDELTLPLMERIKSNSDESRTLSTQRDTLLPKLLSGELRVGC